VNVEPRNVGENVQRAAAEKRQDGRYESFTSGSGSMSFDEMFGLWTDRIDRTRSRHQILHIDFQPVGQRGWLRVVVFRADSPPDSGAGTPP
jgi:hypothetical protein